MTPTEIPVAATTAVDSDQSHTGSQSGIERACPRMECRAGDGHGSWAPAHVADKTTMQESGCDMSFSKWDPSLSVGIAVIDSQHRRIVEYINELESALQRNDQTSVGPVIEQMIDYTITHFAFEEALMERAGYKLFNEHRAVHESFTRLMQDYKKRFARGDDVTRQLLSDLRIWLTNHIKRDDKDYAAVAQRALEEGWVTKTLRRFFG